MEHDDTHLLTTREAAQILGITVREVEDLILTHRLRGIAIGAGGRRRPYARLALRVLGEDLDRARAEITAQREKES